MPVIQFRTTASRVQVEGFPEGCERSGEGSFHVRPGATRVVTEAELEHLKKRSDCSFVVIRLDAVAPVEAAPIVPEVDGIAPEPQEPSGAPEVEGSPAVASFPLEGSGESAGGGKPSKRRRGGQQQP